MSPSGDESWKVLNDYSKTIVATSAGFLAFTGTFAADLIHDGGRGFLIAAWILLLVTIGAAFVVAARIAEMLREDGPTEAERSKVRRGCILAANVSYFCFGAAALCFFLALLGVPDRPSSPSPIDDVIASAGAFIEAIDSTWVPAPPLAVRELGNSGTWEVAYAAAADSVLVLTVEAEGPVVVSYDRRR